MCLLSYHKTPKRATSDIICYKVVYKAGLLNRLFHRFDYISPIYPFKWKINELYYQKFNEPELVDHGRFSINVGFHAYISKEEVIDYYDEVIVKCIVPKGANYFISTEYKHIVAEQMMIVEEIK